MSEVIELSRALIGIDSVNPGLVPGAAGESEIVDFLRGLLLDKGFQCFVVESAEPGRPSLLAWRLVPGAPTVLLNGHVDTVGAGDMADPFVAAVEGDRLLGRGACDMKAGVAGIVLAGERAAATGRVGVVLALVADEEDRSLGTETVIRALPGLGLAPDVALVAEPTWLDLATRHRGYAVVEVVVSGRAAHTSQPEQGANASLACGLIVSAVEEAAASVRAGGGELLVSVVQAGSAPFTIPDSGRVVVERRTVPGEAAAGTLALVSGLAREAAGRAGCTVEVHLTHAREAWELARSGTSADLASRVRVALAERGHEDQGFAAPYWMESALWEAAGIPAVVCGPAGGGLHADDEWVSVHQVEVFAQSLETALLAFATARR